MLNPAQINVIKQTVPVLQAHGEALTRHFYERMFRENPEVLAFFNPAHQKAGTQQRALAGAICAYAQHIDNPQALAGAVELIAQKHASLGILPEHYPIVGENLLASIAEVLGDAATPEILEAWAAAYSQLADIFIQREKQIYQAQEMHHGWQGFRCFIVARREQTSENIASFYLKPADGKPLQAHRAGQYTTVRVSPGAGESPIMRNYSLSNRPGADHFRISVKRELCAAEDVPNGVCSNFLHDHIKEGDSLELAPPSGEFTLMDQPASDKPLVLIAGGVGITPMLSMLHQALESQPGRDIVFIQCAVNGAVRPFAEELAWLGRDYPNLRLHVRLSEPNKEDYQRAQHDSVGFLNAELLNSLVGQRSAEYYLCGPTPMLKQGYRLLLERGAKPEDIHYEFFGPAGDLAA